MRQRITVGGVAVYVKDSIECIRRCDLEVKDLESVWVHINTNGQKILICGIYRLSPLPHPRFTSFLIFSYWNKVTESIDGAKNTNSSDLLILRDLDYCLLV